MRIGSALCVAVTILWAFSGRQGIGAEDGRAKPQTPPEAERAAGNGPTAPDEASDVLAAWRRGVKVRPVTRDPARHTIHPYFAVSPESPDGRWVLFYASTAANGHTGEVRIVERATGREMVLARDVEVEDAHRAACQQWVCGGRRVVFHDVRRGQWVVSGVDVASGKERVLARDRQLGWAAPQGNVVPLYGCHWAPGEHRDLEILDVRTGEIRTVVTAAAVHKKYPEWLAKQFGQRPISVFFPTLSPDLKRVFFKLATPAGGDFRSSKASDRAGLVSYDLEAGEFSFLHAKWGHPSWHPDSRTIFQTGGLLIDPATGAARRIPEMPKLRGSHPAISPDGRLFVSDTLAGAFGGTDKQWAIVVGSMRGKDYVVVHRFDNSRGARSWRRSHPHPAFSADGRRIYFNTSSTEWTQLHVAEAGG